MKIAMIVVRSLMGLLLLFAAVAYFFNFGKPPANMPKPVIDYNTGIAVAHVMTVVKSIELVCGLLFLIGRWVKLAAVVIFPIAINIVLFHYFAMPSGLGPGVFLLVGDLFLAWYYRDTYAPLFAAK